ncbi:MAG: hypothetical protein ACK57N_07240 [Planctomycetia bacterium]
MKKTTHLCIAGLCLHAVGFARDSRIGVGAAVEATPSERATAVPAQERVVEVKVTQVAATAVYIDAGREQGLAVGDRVEFLDGSGAKSEGLVRVVSRRSARVELLPGSLPVPRDARGEVRVPASRLQETAAGEAKPRPDNLPEHPGWSQPAEPWSVDKPLLAPVQGLKPEERRPEWSGRAWTRFDATRSTSDAGDDANYSFFAVGGDATLRNPFGRGGSLRIDAEAIVKSRDAGATSEDDGYLSVDRLVYEVGGTRDEPLRWQFGRFYSSVLPQLGLVDGVEGALRDGRDVVGASLGWLPEPTSERKSFVDLAANAFWRHDFDEERRSSVAFAAQQTMHEGELDRSALVFDGATGLGREFVLRGSAWLDFYGSEDELKDSSMELTEARLSATWRATDDDGLGASWSRIRWPELLRDEYAPVSDELVADGQVDRYSAWAWQEWNPTWRTDERLDLWKDQDDSGATWEVEVRAKDWAWDRGSLALAFNMADGSYSSGPGMRLSADKQWDELHGSFGWSYTEYEEKDFEPLDDSILAQHILYGTLDWALSESWDLSLRADRRFDDAVDAWSAGFLLSTRF